MGSDNKPNSKDDEVKVNYAVGLAFVNIPLAIGYAIATAVFSYGNTDMYAKRIADAATDDVHWVHLAIVVFGRMIAFVNFMPMAFKKNMNGNLRSNPFIYKVVSIDDDPKGAKIVNSDDDAKDVIFDSEGNNGQYNRANRSVHHMIENFGAFIAGIVVVGGIFPFPVFALVCLFAVGRILHQMGYMRGYGKHGPGFLISMLVTVTMEGLALLVFLKGSGTISI